MRCLNITWRAEWLCLNPTCAARPVLDEPTSCSTINASAWTVCAILWICWLSLRATDGWMPPERRFRAALTVGIWSMLCLRPTRQHLRSVSRATGSLTGSPHWRWPLRHSRRLIALSMGISVSPSGVTSTLLIRRFVRLIKFAYLSCTPTERWIQELIFMKQKSW